MNRWTSQKNAFATWSARLEEAHALPWIHRVLDAGEEHGVYLARGAMAGRDERELLETWWLSHYDHARQCYPAGARVAIHGPDGNPREVIVDDLGALSRSLHPENLPEEFILDFRTRAPVMMDGGCQKNGERWFAIRLHSDIWMPWVWGFLEEEDRYPLGPAFANHDLAMLHTPRLNAFLSEVRGATEAAHGTFDVLTEDAGSPFYYAWCVNRDGIELGANP